MNFTELYVKESPSPRAYMRLALNLIKDKMAGAGELVDATNPMALTVEAASSIGAGVLMSVQNQIRGLHAATAMNLAELYKHMADDDFIGRFSDCATGKFMLILDYDELVYNAVNGKIVIPRHLKIKVSNTVFSTQYPIVIRVVDHGGITIHYDTSTESVLQSKYGIPLVWQSMLFNDRKHIAITMTVPQVDPNTRYLQSTAITALRQEIAYSDYFYYAEAFIQVGGVWTPIKTMHVDDVYNPTEPTVCLRVLDKQIVVLIPQVYYNNGLITGEVRLDVYTTKGPISLNTSSLLTESFSLDYSPTALSVSSPEIAAFIGLSRKAVLSPEDIVGGALGLSFEQLKTRVVNRQSAKLGLPITELQLNDVLSLEGFSVDKVSDYVTNRIYVASRGFDEISGRDTATSLSAQMATFTGFVYQLTGNDRVSSVGERIVIRSGALFKRDLIGVVPVGSMEELALTTAMQSSNSAICSMINEGQYLYTPFHYVIDTRGNQVSLNAYQLTTPSITGTELVTTNQEVPVVAITDNFAIKFNDTGYSIAIRCNGNGIPTELPEDSLKAVISWLIPGTTQRYFIEGVRTSTGRNWVYRFELPSAFDIDENEYLSVGSLSSMISLNTIVDIVYYTDIGSPVGDTPPSILDKLPIGTVGVGVSHERMAVNFGHRLKRLWAPIHALGDDADYVQYHDTVYATYASDVYLKDQTGQIKITIDSATGKPMFVKLHNAGDVIIDSTGHPIVLHERGDYVRDSNGDRVLLNGVLSMMFSMDLCLLDGAYRFANDPLTVSYVENCLKSMGYWADDALDAIAGQMLEQTSLYFKPKQSAGAISVISGEGTVRDIASDQKLVVIFDIYKNRYDDLEYRQSIVKRTPEVIAKVFNNSTISLTELEGALLAAFSDAILAVEIKGLFRDQFRAITIADRTARPALAKRLESTLSGALHVTNDLTIQFRPFVAS